MAKKKKKWIRRLFELTGWTVAKVKPEACDQDNLYTFHNHDFMTDPGFVRAYQRGVQAADDDYHWHWRSTSVCGRHPALQGWPAASSSAA